MVRDEKDLLFQHYGKLYRWQLQFDKEMATDAATNAACCCLIAKQQPDTNGSLLPEGWRWMLQLKASMKWWDWVYIQQSNRVDNKLGVFAARDFPRGSMVGFYIGSTVKDSQTEAEANAGKCIKIRNRDGLWQTIKAEPSSTKVGIPLFMGMHYIQTSCHSFRYGSKQYENATKRQNCHANEEGGIMTSKKIVKHTEFLCGHNFTKAAMIDNSTKESHVNLKKGNRKKRKYEEASF
jgi:hypothetical protein